jgi:hypothetical protein
MTTNTIDSNITGLAVAEEASLGVLPGAPVWYEQDPNSYPSTFGGKLKTVARAPIKKNRQRAKGTTVDLDASGGWNTDFTQNNLVRLEQGFFFADARQKATTNPLNGTASVLTAAVSAGAHLTGTGFPRIRTADLVKIKNAKLNTGLFSVAAASATSIDVNEAVANEAFTADMEIAVVGAKFGVGDVAITLSGNVGTLHKAVAPVAATADLTIAVGNAADGDTVTIDGVTYTFRVAVPAVAGEVQIGADDTASATNLKNTINGLSTLTTAHPSVSASSALGVVTATAKLAGASENDLATTEVGANLSWGTATLTGGTGISFHALGLIPGEWAFLSGDAAGTKFVNNVGYFRVGSITDTDLVMDRTTWDVTAEAAGALAIEIFNGTLVQNENDPALIKKRSYQLQRSLGLDDTGTQSQYIVGSVANQYVLDVPLAEKLAVDLSFVAMSTEYRTGAQGLKGGTTVAALDEDAINSSNDIYEMAMTVINPANSNPLKLFGYLSAANLTINNNVSAVKGIGKLGGIGINVGTFDVSGTATAYFTSVAANIAITNNDDVDCHFVIAKHNAGSVFDISLLQLGGGDIKIEANKPITVPLTTDAAQGEHGSTLTHTVFPYLPTVAMPVAV